MIFEWSVVRATWAVASALALVLVGIVSLRGGDSRPRGAFAFGAFAIAWGAQVTFGNLIDVVESDTMARVLLLLFIATSFPLAFLLIEFAVAHAHEPRRRRWLVLRVTAAVAAVASATLLALDPGAFIGSGSLFGPLVVLPHYAAFAVALVVLDRAKRGAATPRISVRAATLLAGLGVFAAFIGGFYLFRYTVTAAIYGIDGYRLYLAIFAGLTAVVAGVAFRIARDVRLARTRVERRREMLLLAALVVPLAAGAIEGILSTVWQQTILTVGLWRLAGMAVIAYGIALWRLADLPQRATRAAATGAGASAAAATGVAAYGAATLLTGGTLFPIAAGLLTLGFTLVPGLRIARRLLHRATRGPWQDDVDALYGQRVEAYRAALESSLARNTMDEDEDFLGALRERFGITESEDRLLRHYARSCVLAPRQAEPGSAYERLRLLGEGGAGRTWLARDRVRDRLVVLKEPLERWQREPTMREAVLREARLAARVRHPNVIRVEEVIEHRGAPIIVMEYAEGGSMADLLRRRGVLSWRDAIELIVPVLRGVEAIHGGGIVHRDLKPSNVLLTLEGEPKIADFGIAIAARAHDVRLADRTIPDGTTFVGTYAYLAPEVRAGGMGDRRSDVYACAAMLHEALFASPPGLAAPVLASNDVPAELSRVLARALSAEPAQRPASARALAEELTNLVARREVL